MLTAFFLACSEIRPVESVETSRADDSKVESCTTLDFRFLTVYDMAFSSNIRHVELFLEPKSFNEANLKKLFAYISAKYAAVPVLITHVNTDWTQLSATTGDCPGTGTSAGGPEDPTRYDHHRATYRRDAQTEYFDFSTKLKEPGLERVWLKKRQ